MDGIFTKVDLDFVLSVAAWNVFMTTFYRASFNLGESFSDPLLAVTAPPKSHHPR
jgi:hypothetical protein